jgi:hypothetical protein
VTACGAVSVAVAPEPLWLGSVSTCVLHMSGCGWSCALESWPPYARSRYKNGDSDAMPGYNNRDVGAGTELTVGGEEAGYRCGRGDAVATVVHCRESGNVDVAVRRRFELRRAPWRRAQLRVPGLLLLPLLFSVR